MNSQPDRMASPRPPLWFLLLSHHSYSKISHTIQLNLGQRRVYFCTRCTGIGIGILAALFYTNILVRTFAGAPWLIVIFTLPAIVDWLVQVFGISESTSIRRLATGTLVGQAYLVLLVSIVEARLSLFECYLEVFGMYSVVLYFLFRKTRVMNSYMASSWP